MRIIEIAKKRGFIWGPTPEIYGGSSGFYDYGPLGSLLKRNIENVIRYYFFQYNFVEVESPIVSIEKVWKASGHLDRFHDPVAKCEKGHEIRIDKLIEEKLNIIETDLEKLKKIVEENNIKCDCGAKFKEFYYYNLMMKTTLFGGETACLRAETATMLYLLYPRLFEYFRKKLPFGAFMIGRVFRNEISPRKWITRMREFTQAEGQIFLEEDEFAEPDWEEKIIVYSAEHQEKNLEPEEMTLKEMLNYLNSDYKTYAFAIWFAKKVAETIGLEVRFRQHRDYEKAHYAKDAWDMEVKTSYGWLEVAGIHDRGKYDLTRHKEFSGEKFEPVNIIEISFGVDRLVFATLDTSFTQLKNTEGFIFNPIIAPIKAVILPLVSKDGLPEIAKEIYNELKKYVICYYDEKGSIGKRYARSEEIGVPFAITIDYQTKEDDTVTIRFIQDGSQIRVHKENLKEFLLEKCYLNRSGWL